MRTGSQWLVIEPELPWEIKARSALCKENNLTRGIFLQTWGSRKITFPDNLAIMQAADPFIPGETLQLTDSDGVECHARIVEIIGRPALLEHWVPEPQE